MEENQPDTLSVIELVGYDASEQYAKGYGDRLSTDSVSVETLKNRLCEFSERLEEMLSGLKASVSNYELEEVELQVELSTEGAVRLIAAVSAEAKGGITLKYKRRGQNDHE